MDNDLATALEYHLAGLLDPARRMYQSLLVRQPDNADALHQLRLACKRTLEHWQQDSDFASARGGTALAKLPADEQPGWRQLWADVEKTLAKLRQENNRKEKSSKK
jgi:hypothetical protein